MFSTFVPIPTVCTVQLLKCTNQGSVVMKTLHISENPSLLCGVLAIKGFPGSNPGSGFSDRFPLNNACQ